MSRKKKGAPVVIVRKDKKLRKTPHLLAFMLTGGASGVVTAAKAATTVASARSRPLGAHRRTSGTPPIMHPAGWSSAVRGVRWRRSGNETVAGTGSCWRQLVPSTGTSTGTGTDVERLDQVTVRGQVGKIGQRAV